MTKYYKVVRVRKDGSLVSSFASGTGEAGSSVVSPDPSQTYHATMDYPMLTYHPHRLISAPKGSEGLFLATDENLSNRMDDVLAEGEFEGCEVRAYEAQPLAPILQFFGFPTCMKVRIGRLVKTQ